MRLAQAVLFVHDMDRMTRFYQAALGLEPVEVAPGWARLAAGDAVLALHAIRGAAAGAAFPERAEAAIKLCFHADDVAAARAALVAAGAQMRDLVRFDAVAYCDGVDPEGNVFQITSR